MKSPSLEERHQIRTPRAHKITWGDIKALNSQAMTMAPLGDRSPGTLFLLMCAIITCNSLISIDLKSWKGTPSEGGNPTTEATPHS